MFLYLVPALVFLLPTSLVSAELASGWSGGVYNWVARGISKPAGFLAVWCQFAMTIVVGGGALGLGLLVPYLFYRFRKPSWRQLEPVEEVRP